MQQHNQHMPSTDNFRRTRHRVLVVLDDTPFIESMEQPVVGEHALHTLRENAKFRPRVTFTKARPRRQLI